MKTLCYPHLGGKKKFSVINYKREKEAVMREREGLNLQLSQSDFFGTLIKIDSSSISSKMSLFLSGEMLY